MQHVSYNNNSSALQQCTDCMPAISTAFASKPCSQYPLKHLSHFVYLRPVSMSLKASIRTRVHADDHLLGIPHNEVLAVFQQRPNGASIRGEQPKRKKRRRMGIVTQLHNLRIYNVRRGYTTATTGPKQQKREVHQPSLSSSSPSSPSTSGAGTAAPKNDEYPHCSGSISMYPLS